VSEVKRKKGESFESLIRRAKRQWQSSGKILEARKVQFFLPSKSKNVTKKQSLARAKKISKINYLRKIGRLPEEEELGFRRKRR